MSTYTLIQSTTLGSNTSSVVFSNIPQTYTDLLVVALGRTTDTTGSNVASDCAIRFNASGSGYSTTWLRSNTGSANSFRATSGTYAYGIPFSGRNATANTYSGGTMYIPNYANTTRNKTYIAEGTLESNLGNYDSADYIVAGLWQNTAAITSITFVDGYANIALYSSFSLYGIKNT